MNIAIIAGNLTRDPELRTTKTGKAVCSFSVATNDFKGGAEVTEYHNCTAWEGLAELIGGKAKKGSSVEIVGRLETQPYTNKDGVEVKATKIIVSQFKFGARQRSQERQSEPDPDLGW